MNRKEYLTRIFNNQLASLQNEIKSSKDNIEELEGRLIQERLLLEDTLKLIKIAQDELEKANASQD